MCVNSHQPSFSVGWRFASETRWSWWWTCFDFSVRSYSSGYSSQVPSFCFDQWCSVLFVVLVGNKCNSNCRLRWHQASLVLEPTLVIYFARFKEFFKNFLKNKNSNFCNNKRIENLKQAMMKSWLRYPKSVYKCTDFVARLRASSDCCAFIFLMMAYKCGWKKKKILNTWFKINGNILFRDWSFAKAPVTRG